MYKLYIFIKKNVSTINFSPSPLIKSSNICFRGIWRWSDCESIKIQKKSQP